MSEPKIKVEKLKSLIPDEKNANRGTAKGQKAIVGSIQRSRLGRSIVIDRHNRIIGGNKTVEAVAEVLGVDAEILVVETEGDRLLVNRRVDLDLDDNEPNNPARQLAYSDNLTSHFSFELDPEVVMADIEGGFDFGAIDVSDLDLGELGIISDAKLPNEKPQTEPQLTSEVFVEIYCTNDDLKSFMDTLNDWSDRPGVSVNIS